VVTLLPSIRYDGSFAAATSKFNPFSNNEPISFDFGISTAFHEPIYRTKPRISYLRPPLSYPFDGVSVNGLLVGAGVIASGVALYFLGKKLKWWK
jgi:hypothetical protein